MKNIKTYEDFCNEIDNLSEAKSSTCNVNGVATGAGAKSKKNK